MKNHEELFWLAFICAFAGGAFLGADNIWAATIFFFLSGIMLITKWILNKGGVKWKTQLDGG